MSQPTRRPIITFALILSAVIFGMILASSMELTPVAVSQESGSGQIASVAAGASGLPGFADLAEAVDPAVVSIQAATIERNGPRRGTDPFRFFFGPRDRQDQEPDQEPRDQQDFRSDSGGSGFVVSADGLVVTNYHVIRGADEVNVVLNGRPYKAAVVGTDPATDIALLKVDAGGDLTYLALGDSEMLRVGEWVLAVGSPLGLSKSVTVGVVSAKGRALGINDISFENFIQTDAAINFGNSGGPLINMRGEVVGINTAINYGAENIGFAVPANTLKQILPQLRDTGAVRRGYIGVTIQNLDYASAEAYGLPDTNGALVTQVVPGSPADNAGLRHSDIIRRVDGRVIEETRDLIDYVSAQGPEAEVELDVLRNGEPLKKQVQLTERPSGGSQLAQPQRPEEGGIDWLGLRYQTLTDELRQTHELPEDLQGVLITQVAPTSPLYEDGVRSAPGVFNVISEVNGRKVSDVEEMEAAIGEARSGSRLRLYVRRFAGGQEGQPVFSFPPVP